MLQRRAHYVMLAAGLMAMAGTAAAQSKVGIVNLQRAIVETAEIKKAQAEMEAKYKPRQDELEKMQRDLQTIQQQLRTMQGKLTPQAEQDLTLQGQRKQRDMQRLSEDLQGEVDHERNEILSRSGQRMRDVIQQLAQAKDLDVVVDAVDTLYFKAALDLTQEAIAAYDKAHPVK